FLWWRLRDVRVSRRFENSPCHSHSHEVIDRTCSLLSSILEGPFSTTSASKIATSVTPAEMAKMLVGAVHGLIMATSSGPTTPASAATDPLIPITREI